MSRRTSQRSLRVDPTLWMVKLARAGVRMNQNDRTALSDWETVPHTIEEAVDACRTYRTRATLEGPMIAGRLPKDRAKRQYDENGRILPAPPPGPGTAALRYSGNVQVSIGEKLLESDPFYSPSWRREPAPRTPGYHVLVTTPWRGHATFIPWDQSDWERHGGRERSFDEIARKAIEKVYFLGDASRGTDGRAIVSNEVPLIIADWVEGTAKVRNPTRIRRSKSSR